MRTDTLKRLRPEEIFPDYQPKDISQGASFKVQGMTQEQRDRIGDFVVYDSTAGAVRRPQPRRGRPDFSPDPALEGVFTAKLLDGSSAEVMPVFENVSASSQGLRPGHCE